MRLDRWESGSAFPLITGCYESPHTDWLPKDALLHGTGRQALRALLQHGRDVYGWRRLLMPSYSCPDLIQALRDVLPIVQYPYSPGIDSTVPEPRRNEVLLATVIFGRPPKGAEHMSGDNIIFDVTHDPVAPWLGNLQVGYVTASLRKTLPVPDGAATWSPRGLRLPKDPPSVGWHAESVALGISAMCLKSEYLDGADVEKAAFLNLFANTENRFALSEPAKISKFSRELVGSFPVHEWRRQRLANIARLADALRFIDSLTVLPNTFGLVLLFDTTAQRDEIRLGLIEARIYPAILWTMGTVGATSADRDFSQRMLFLHTDFRWGNNDMDRIAEQVASILDRKGGHPRCPV